MSRIDLSTAGIKLGYGVETVAGTQPTKFTRITGVKSLPDINPKPETMDSTTLDETDFKTYVEGLRDTGGAVELTFNMTKDLETAWPAVVSAAKTAKSTGLSMWFVFYIPGLTNSFYFTGNPSALGFGGADVGKVLENKAYVTPTGNIGWAQATEPTAAA